MPGSNSHHLKGRHALALAAAALLSLGAQAQSSYNFLPLKASSKLGSSAPNPLFINNKGVVAGTSDIAVNPRWTYSKLFGLPTLTADRWLTVGSTWSRTGAITVLDAGTGAVVSPILVGDINNNGVVAGTDSKNQPVAINGSVKTLLTTPGADGTALGINDQGTAVGRSSYQATIWRNSLAQNIHPLSGGLDYSDATSINNLDQVTVTIFGGATDQDGYFNLLPQACALHEGNALVPLSSGGKRWCRVVKINDRGTSIGQVGAGALDATSTNEIDMVGVTWQGHGEPQPLPLPTGWVTAAGSKVRLVPQGINTAGVVVGDIVTSVPSPTVSGAFYETTVGFVYRNGQTFELSKLLKGQAKAVIVYRARDINDEGRIVANLAGFKPGLFAPASGNGVLTPNP
jgi:hypothetical protein